MASRFSRPPCALGTHSPALAAVVAVEHRGHRIHAQAVDAVALQPVQGVADQVVAHLGAGVVEDQRFQSLWKPSRGSAYSYSAVPSKWPRPCESVGKCAGTQSRITPRPGRVRRLDEGAEVARRAEARGRRIQADRLVAPGAVEGMLADRQQLDVGEAHVARIGHQRVGQLAVVEPFVAVLAPPRAQVHLVDADRRLARIGRGALRAAAPRAAAAAAPRRRCPGRSRAEKPKGSALRSSSPSRRQDLELVASPAATCGAKISHTPHSRRSRIMWRRPSHWLKSPTTETRRAFGAQTAKATPRTPSISRRCAPSCSKGRRCVPSASSQTSVSPSTGGKR